MRNQGFSPSRDRHQPSVAEDTVANRAGELGRPGSPCSFLDLFSGIGGFALGLERAGHRTAAFCEISPKCRHLLAHHWPEVPIYDDVQTLTAERLAADGVAVDAIAAGFPCQDLSLNGYGAGLDGARSGLFWQIVRLVGELIEADRRPRVVVLENVSAITDRGLGDVLRALASLGYDVWWDCARASNFGAPQLRDRFWCVAYPAGSEAGEQVARNCHREFEAARAEQASPTGRGPGVLGGANWNPEPRIRRVVDGLSANVDRVSVLGNAVVPEIPYRLGRAILAANQKDQAHVE
jgi:DNA (cytosine-5)-methyltransferase 1